MLRLGSLLRGGVAAMVLSVSASAYAQPAGQDVATAQALFDEGKRLMDARNFAEACPKLVESQRLDPAGGTMLIIALCHEAEGKTASAWAEFSLALSDARKDKRADRERAAADHLRALEPKLTRIKLVVLDKSEGLEVRRDGTLAAAAQWSTPLPIDPGDHLIEARAPGKKGWSSKVAIRGEGQTVEVKVPLLEDEAIPPPPPREGPALGKPMPHVPIVERPPPEKSSNIGPFVVGAIGIVAIGTGAVFGIIASSKWSDVETACPNKRCTSSSSVELGKDAGQAADLATVFVVAGGAVVTASALWLLLSNHDRKETSAIRLHPLLGLGAAGLSLEGAL